MIIVLNSSEQGGGSLAALFFRVSLATKKLSGEFSLELSGLRTQLVSMRLQVWSLALPSAVRIWRCLELSGRLQMLWLWRRPAAAVSIQPLAWERHMPQVWPLKKKKKRSGIQKVPNKCLRNEWRDDFCPCCWKTKGGRSSVIMLL